MAAPEPIWLDVDDVVAWLTASGGAAGVQAQLVTACAAAVEPQVQRARPDQWVTAEDGTRTYTPDAEVYQAAVMLAARVARRRNTPSGIETMADTVTYVSRYDPEIERALWQGHWARPGVG